MKSALYYYCNESASDYYEQFLNLYRYAVSIGTTPCAMYLDHPVKENSHPAYDQMLSDARKELFSLAILYHFPGDRAKLPDDFCFISLPDNIEKT